MVAGVLPVVTFRMPPLPGHCPYGALCWTLAKCTVFSNAKSFRENYLGSGVFQGVPVLSDLMRNMKADELRGSLGLSHRFHLSGSQISFC